MERSGIRVKCPNPSCTKGRLFDVDTIATGTVSIKCDKCGTLVSINLKSVTKDKRHLILHR